MNLQVTWTLREPPWIAEAVIGRGEVGKELARRALLRSDEALESLRAVIADDWLILLGPASALPWADGAVYLGQEPGTPMYLPTLLAPSIPVQLLDRAMRKQHSNIAAPYAVLPDSKLVISLFKSSKVDNNSLKNWLEGNSDATA